MKTMRCLFHLLLLAALPAAAQTTYYLAANGADQHAGTSPDQPWQTLARASTQALGPGDQLLLRRGDTFAGTLTLTGATGSAAAPVRVADYGDPAAPAPVLSGAVALSGWQNQGNNRWVAACPAPAAGAPRPALLEAGRPLPLGRTPNPDAPGGGYLTVSSHVGTSQLTAADLPAGPDWTGAEVVARTKHWILDRLLVTSQPNANTLTLQLVGSSAYTPQDGWGYFLQNHPATLDREGEWCYLPGPGQIMLYTARDPNARALSAAVGARAVVLSGGRYLTLQNLTLSGTLTDALLASGVSALTVQGCQVQAAEGNGLTFSGQGRGLRLLGNSWTDVQNTALELSGDPYAFGGPQRYTNVRLAGNTLRRVASQRGRGRSGDNQGLGLNLRADTLTVEDNTLDSLGYIGLTFKGSHVLVQHNQVTNFCLIRDDGGGIYSYNGDEQDNSVDRTVRQNLVRSGPGDPNGAADSGGLGDAHGIYLDDYTGQVTLDGNVVADCSAVGLLLHNPRAGQVVQRNLAFNCRKGQLLVDSGQPDPANLGLIVTDNVFYAMQPAQPAAAFYLKNTDIRSLGQFDRNVYASPFGDADRLYLNLDDQGHGGRAPVYQSISLAQWQRLNPASYDPGSAPGPARPPFALSSTGGSRMCNSPNDVTFDNGNTCYTPFAEPAGSGGTVAPDPASPLDGGALKLTAANYLNANGLPFGGYLGLRPYTGTGALAAGQTLLLRFDAVASRAGEKLSAFLYNPTTYQLVGPRVQSVAVGPQRQRYELALPAAAAASASTLTMRIEQDGQTVWVDNLSLVDATLQLLDPGQYLTLLTNPTAAPRTLSLPPGSAYLDPQGGARSGTLTLAPWAATVLLRTAGAAGPLPVELTAFAAEAAGPDAALSWRTASEQNAAYFAVERSPDGRQFADRGRLAARGGAGRPTSYAFRDPAAAGAGSLAYYRLRQVDQDGRASYSPVRVVRFGSAAEAGPRLFPNPTAGPAHLDLRAWPVGPQPVELLDATGRRVLALTLPGGQVADLDLRGLPAGLYLLRGLGGLSQRVQKAGP